MKRWTRPVRGVSLIEALVALAVMAFGMLAVVGLQATLRGNGDLSKQRAEAVRIAQAAVEDWRSIVAVQATAGQVDYTDLVTDGPTTVAGINATYQRSRAVTVTPNNSPPMKSLYVTVAWTDRTGTVQSVQLSTVVAGVSPELAGSLAMLPTGAPARQPLGRNSSIPFSAKDLGNGTSVFKPPQGGAGTVAWVFNNTTGLITGLCNVATTSTTSSLLLSDVSACSANTSAQLLAGYVRFAELLTQPSAAESQSPSGIALNLDITLQADLVTTGPTSSANPGVPLGWSCFDDADTVSLTPTPGATVSYFCAITSSTSGTWAGRSRIVPSGWTIAAGGAGNYKVCRYTPLTADNPAGAKNADHPLDYTEATGAWSAPNASLINQNFLVISAAHSCPTDTPAPGDFVNSNTLVHQDGTLHYENLPTTPTPNPS